MRSRAFVIGMRPQPSLDLPTEELCRVSGQNVGNLVYAYAISSHLESPRVLKFRSPTDRINAAGQIGVIQGANQLGAHFSAGAERARRMRDWTVKLVVLGLGAQSDLACSIPSNLDVQWIQSIVEHAPAKGPNLGVRGRFTQDVLHHYGLGGHAEIIGCPSLFINPAPDLGQRIASRFAEGVRRFAVVAGHESWTHLAEIEASLARLVTETGGSYICQHGPTLMKVLRDEAHDIAEADLDILCKHVRPGESLGAAIRWIQRHGRVFFDVPQWIEYCRQVDFVVGTRIHGTVVALQAGVPALCIVHDSRTLELCRTMSVPHVPAAAVPPGVTLEWLTTHSEFDGVAFDSNRRRLCRRYVNFLQRNQLQPVHWLADLAGFAR